MTGERPQARLCAQVRSAPTDAAVGCCDFGLLSWGGSQAGGRTLVPLIAASDEARVGTRCGRPRSCYRAGPLAGALLILAAAGVAWPALAQPSQGAVAMAYLRPVRAGPTRSTQIERLGEAQRLRAIAENVLEAVSGRRVLRHDALRDALGSGYLVELFDCAGETRCLLSRLERLRDSSVDSVLVGEYSPAGDGFRVELRRLHLAHGRSTHQTTLEISSAQIESLDGWRAALVRMFLDVGTVRVVTNVTEFGCTLDARPCLLDPSGLIRGVSEGDHVLALEKPGYKDVTKVVSVVTGAESRAVVPMERLPIEVQTAPDATGRVPVFAPAQQPQVKPFGFISLTVSLDDQNTGDSVEFFVRPDAQGGPVATAMQPFPSGIGVQAQHPKFGGGWEARGVFLFGYPVSPTLKLLMAYLELVQREAGFALSIGLRRSTLNSLNPGTLTLPLGFGNLVSENAGVLAVKSFGPLVVELGVGQPRIVVDLPHSGSPLPCVLGRVAYVNEDVSGLLYGDRFPLTVSLSGMWGTERVGAGQASYAAALDPSAATPLIEDLRVWLASFELYVPFRKRLSLSGEAYVGQGAHRVLGAIFQGSRLELSTGRHRALVSAGGWAQLVVHLAAALEVRVLVGAERILSGLEFGDDDPRAPPMVSNQLSSVSVNFWAAPKLSLGVQAHRLSTVFKDPVRGQPQSFALAFVGQLGL